MSDPFNLQRFLNAQGPVIDDALAELRLGRKESHWMWYVFPQVRGLGQSSTAVHYSLSGVAEARAFLAHPILGERLRSCCQVLLKLAGHSAEGIFGYIDAMKLRSSMTLFAQVSSDHTYNDVLLKYYEGRADSETLSIIRGLTE